MSEPARLPDHVWEFVDGLYTKAKCTVCGLMAEDSKPIAQSPEEAEQLLFGGCPGQFERSVP